MDQPNARASSETDSPVCDAVVIGGGPAGLTAAIYLARYIRRVAVIDAGASRMTWIPVSHNVPGFPTGLPGTELLRRLRAQAETYGVAIQHGTVAAVDRNGSRGFEAVTHRGRLRARALLIATGVVDEVPAMPDLLTAIQRGTVRVCPICDAYE